MNHLAKAIHPTRASLWQKTLWSLFLVVWCGILGATAAWAASDFVVLGHEGIWVRQGSTVVSGDVGANVTSVGPFLASDQEVTIGRNVVVQDPTSRVLGDTMRLKSGSQLQDVFVNTLKGSGQIFGTLTTPLDLPLVSAFPPVPLVIPGVQDFDVPKDGMLALDAGSYGLLKVGKRAILTLTGGLYHFREWDIRAEAKVYAAAPVEIRVSEHLRTWSETVVGPAPTAPTLTAVDVRIMGTGVNGTTGAINATPKAVQFGGWSHVRANVYAPNGTLWVKQGSTATGAFVGKWVRMGNGGTITLEGGFGLGAGGGNTAPEANAGSDQTVQVTDTVQLDGSDSTDVNGDLLTYSWTLLTQPAGSTATLDDPTSVMPTFVADAPGSYEIELIVNDGTVNSVPDTVRITTINSPPVADAGPDQTVFVTQTVLLDGTNSSDVDKDPLTFLWSFVSRPNGSTATLSDPTSPTPDFTVDFPGIYEVQLIVNDGAEDSVADTVVIDTQNSKPVANAEPDQTVPIGSTVLLDGSNSSDVDGDPLTHLWALIAMPTGSTATLSDPTAVQPTFVADLPGIFVVQLIVNDGNEDSDPATVTITTANTPPVAEAGPDQTVPISSTVQLDGSASNDLEGTPLTFLWSITGQPNGSTATLSDATVVNPTFITDVVGSYVMTLVVNDGTDDSTPDSVLIMTENIPPVANAGPDQTIVPGATVQLDGNGSTDPDGNPLTYQWSLLSTPVGSGASLSDATLVNPTLVADLTGTYVVQLIINDGMANSVPDTIIITASNAPPTLNSIGDQSVVLGQPLALTLSGSDPNGDPISFGATTVPLPDNLTLNGTSGQVTFQPDGSQVGAHVLTFFASDGVGIDEETITITVQGPAPGGITALQGRILDTNAFVNGGTEVPVVGATVSFLSTGLSVTSDTQGFFTLSGIPAATQVLDIDASTAQAGPGGETYASFREQINLIANVTNIEDRPFFLPQNDPNSQMTVNGTPVTQVDPNNTTVVSNPVLGVSITIPAHTAKNADGTDYSGTLTISEVPDALAPAALPDTLAPGLLVTIQPPGVTFATPVAISFPNIDQGLPGEEVDLWSLDPATGRFTVVGALEVSPDGTTLTTKSGGVLATDWHCPCPPGAGGGSTGGGGGGSGGTGGGGPNGGLPPGNQPAGPNSGGDEGDGGDEGCPGSTVSICGGDLSIQHQLATYQSLGVTRGPLLQYRHLNADPRPILFNNPTIPVRSIMPNTMSIRLEIAGIDQGQETFTDLSPLKVPRTGDEVLRQVAQFDASALPTGSYPYGLTLTNHYAASSVGTLVQDTVLVHNERDSGFGAGWTLEGLDRLHPQTNGDVVLTRGNGGALLFRRPVPGNFALDVDLPLPSNFLAPVTNTIVEDVNGDGLKDLAVSGTFGAPSRIAIFFGQSDGSAVFQAEYLVSGRSEALRAADFDHDGHLDVLSVNRVQNDVVILWNDGTGAFPTLDVFPDPGSPNFVNATVGDFNEDGNMDFATPNGNTQDVTVWLGSGTRGPGAFTLTTTIPLGFPGPNNVVTADFNLDGHLDLVAPRNNRVSVLYGDGTGNFPTEDLLTGISTEGHVATEDVNQDGFPDLVISTREGGLQQAVRVYENNRVGGFWPPEIVELGTIVSTFQDIEDVQTADLDNDGQPEIVVVNQNFEGAVHILVRDDIRGFEVQGNLDTLPRSRFVTPQDWDGDGGVDLIVAAEPDVAGSLTDRVQIFRNQGLDTNTLVSPLGDFSTMTPNPDGTVTRRLKNGTIIQFDGQGLQTSVTDRNGNITTYLYDAQDHLEKIIDPVGLETVFDYGGGTHLSKITDPVGRDTLFETNAAGDLIKITDPDLSTREFTYDPRHRLVQQQAKRGFLTQYEYNVAGRLMKATRPDTSTRGISPGEVVGLVDPASGQGTETTPIPIVRTTEVIATFTDGKGQVASTKTDNFGNGTVRTDALGRTTTISRNFDGNPVVTTNPNGAITRSTYDDRGNVLSLTEAEGLPEERTTTFEYDPTFNLLTKMIDPAGKETTIVRNLANGNPERVINPLLDERIRTFRPDGLVESDTDENGNLTTFTYDPLTGNLETMVDAEGHTTRFVRDLAGRVTTLIEGEGTPEQRTRTFTYDGLNRLKTATDGTANPPTQFAYDGQGNVTTTTLPTNEQEVRTYDPLNRGASIDDPLRGLSTFVYDLNGNLERTENALNDPTTMIYDAANQLKTITDALNGEQAFTYDLEGNVKTFTDARAKITTFDYDLRNRQITRTNHIGLETTFTYDTRDNLLDTVDPKTQLIHRVYDDLSRLTDITTPDNAFGIQYDKVGNPTDVTDADSQVTFTYDGLNRVETALTSATSGLQPQVLLTSVYDAVGNRRQLDEDTGTSVTNFVYDLAGRLQALTPPAGPAMQVGLSYDPSGRLASIVYPNTVVTQYGYDTKGRLDALSHTAGGNPSFASFGYTYNPVGNILAILDQVTPTENRAHTYDALQRLKTGGTTSNTETYDYDLVGNRTTSFLSSTHTHDDLNRLLEDDAFTYIYDNNGNLLTKTDKANSDVTTYHWDAQDQLVQIDRPDSTTVTYKYDGLGRRIEKNVNGTITRYVYDGQDILLEYDGTNTFLARYSHGDQVDQPLVLQKGGVGFFYYHSNHQGSITHLTDSNGTIANSYVYDSYGRRLSVAESVLQPYSYTGREFDVESELYFYRARYFDAVTGRFLSEDPIGLNARDQNLYRYVFNNPTNFVDSNGTFPGGPSTSGPVMTQGENGGGGGSPPPGMTDTAGRLDTGGVSPMRGRKGGQAVAEGAARIAAEARAQGLMDKMSEGASCKVPESFFSNDPNIGPEQGDRLMGEAEQRIFGRGGF